jgi:hypothetical protein
MTKKDFELIAKVFAEFHCSVSKDTLVKALSEALSRENPRFDSGRFLVACGVEQ